MINISIEGRVFILARKHTLSQTNSSVEFVTFKEAIAIRNKELEGSREETILTIEEINSLLKSKDTNKYTECHDYYVFIHVLINTFSRIGETLALGNSQ